jgi:undecaprenyl-diphosphatase
MSRIDKAESQMKFADKTNRAFASKLRNFGKRLGLRLVVGLTAAAATLFLFARLASETFEGDARQFDDWSRSAIHQFTSPDLTSVMRVVTALGTPSLLFGLSLITAIGFAIAKKYRAMILLIATMVGATILDQVLKLSFHRARPEPFFDIVSPGSFSFPSGHALASFCFYSTIAVLISRRTAYRSVRVVTWTLAVLLVLLIGLSRIYLGVHYATDVLAGYSAAFIWVMIIAAVDRTFRRKASAEDRMAEPER